MRKVELATVVVFDRQGWITILAAVLLALITLFTSYTHVDFLGAASIDLPQQAGVPCIAAALATAVAEAQLATNDRAESAAIRDRAAVAADEERRRAAGRARRQAQSDLAQLRYQLEPNELHARQVRALIALLEQVGDVEG